MLSLLTIGLIILGVVAVVAIICAFAWYRIVPPSEAHMVVTPRGKIVASPDANVAVNGNASYYAIPNWVPSFGREVRVMDVTTKELVLTQETYEKNQARYEVKSSTKYRIKDVQTASETFVNDESLKEMLKEVIQASVRAVTVKYDVTEARAKKKEMADAVRAEINDDLGRWGLNLESFQLVDFQDTEDSNIISDISKRREVEIQSRTREENAEKTKSARVKEAEAEEIAKQREIKKDELVAMAEQNKLQMVSEQRKLAKEKEYEVKQVEIIKQAEIDKEQAIVKANEDRETEEIRKEKKRLEGEGDRLRQEEQAKGEAAPIREMGFAEAEAKEKLQDALNKFKDEAIRALVAEKIVQKDERIGIATAEALKTAELKVFSGGADGESGFKLAELIGSLRATGSKGELDALLNRIAKPNDLGIEIGKKKEPKEEPEGEDVVLS